MENKMTHSTLGRIFRYLIAVIAALAGSAASAGALIGFKFESDHADSRYRLGEEAVITVTATN